MSSTAFDGYALLREQNDLLARASMADVCSLQFLRLRLSAQQRSDAGPSLSRSVLFNSPSHAPNSTLNAAKRENNGTSATPSPPQRPAAVPSPQDSPDPTAYPGAVHEAQDRGVSEHNEQGTPMATRQEAAAANTSEPRISHSSTANGEAEATTSVSCRSSTQPTAITMTPSTTATLATNTESITTNITAVAATAAVSSALNMHDQLPASVAKRRSILGTSANDTFSIDLSRNNESTLSGGGVAMSEEVQHASTMNGATHYNVATATTALGQSLDERPATALNHTTTSQSALSYAELPLPIVEQELVPCPSCGRKFLPESLQRHLPPCERQREREVRRRRDAEARERRPHTTETLSVTMSGTSFLQQTQTQPMSRLASGTFGPGRLSRRHSLVESVSSDQAAQAAVMMNGGNTHSSAAATAAAAGLQGKNETSVVRQSKWRQQSLQLRSALAGTTSAMVEDDRMQCPYCGRRFTADAAVRHIPLCFEKTKWPTHRK